MKSLKLRKVCIALFAAAMLLTLSLGLFKLNTAAFADTRAYEESYRNRLAYSAGYGWNNDPNGLVYVDGTYHMYYQYTWDWRANDGQGETEPYWDNMSWGHATSTDLVHWEEQPVAIPAYQTGDDGKFYAMMFSGSCVYDEGNTSGLFETENGRLKDGQGIVAILTQPSDEDGGQRQILAYSKDNGQSFNIYGEILGANDDGGVGDGEFRDPKVFWNDKTGKWLLAVGGGSVRMYSSDNLKDWDYLGETGYWGECPDISRYVVDGQEKYVLIISPEDKTQSYVYNKVDRSDYEMHYAECYVVGDLDENGLFVSEEPLKKLSGGYDSYAFQSFNNVGDGKVYGVSWSACWKTVGDYVNFRSNYNGGLTIVTELNLIKENGEYILTRTPVENYETMRGEKILSYSDTLAAGKNALAGVRADVADIELGLDFTDSDATYAELCLRVSAAERIAVRYDVKSGILCVDRSQSSLLAQGLFNYPVKFESKVALEGGRLELRILLDRAFINVFANGGRASVLTAVFPSASSNAMTLVSDGDLSVTADIYRITDTFIGKPMVTEDQLIVTTDKIDTTVGTTSAVIASSYAESFDVGEVEYTVSEGADVVCLTAVDNILFIDALKKGYAKIAVDYKGQTEYIDVYVYEDGFISDVEYDFKWLGFSLIREDGLLLSTATEDAFYFGTASGTDIIYSATFTPSGTTAQAGGIVFGVSDNYRAYCVVTADIAQNKIKLWQAGVGDLTTADFNLEAEKPVTLKLIVLQGTATVFVNGGTEAALSYELEDYSGGKVGLNVYNAEMIINNVTFTNIGEATGSYNFAGCEVLKVENVSENCQLTADDYTFENGRFALNDGYLSTLESGGEYVFSILTDCFGQLTLTVVPDFTQATLNLLRTVNFIQDDLILCVGGANTVNAVYVDGVSVEYALRDGNIIVPSTALSQLSVGAHTVTVYTDSGRPQVNVNLTTKATSEENGSGSGNTGNFTPPVEEETEKATHTFLYIDLAIFAALIIAYVTFSVISKRRAK